MDGGDGVRGGEVGGDEETLSAGGARGSGAGWGTGVLQVPVVARRAASGRKGVIWSGQNSESSEAKGVPLEGDRPAEVPGCSNTRSARGPVATRATEAGPAKTTGPGIARLLVPAEVDRDEI